MIQNTISKEMRNKIDNLVKVYQPCEYYKVTTENVHGINLLKIVLMYTDSTFDFPFDMIRDIVIFANRSVSILLVRGGYFTFNFYDRTFTLSI